MFTSWERSRRCVCHASVASIYLSIIYGIRPPLAYCVMQTVHSTKAATATPGTLVCSARLVPQARTSQFRAPHHASLVQAVPGRARALKRASATSAIRPRGSILPGQSQLGRRRRAALVVRVHTKHPWGPRHAHSVLPASTRVHQAPLPLTLASRVRQTPTHYKAGSRARATPGTMGLHTRCAETEPEQSSRAAMRCGTTRET